MRWLDEAREAAVRNGYSVVDEDGVSDYQGWGVLLLSGPSWAVLSWSYGSCGGCDSYEGMNEEALRFAFDGNITTFGSEEEARTSFKSSKGW